jgi:hypothetical protein
MVVRYTGPDKVGLSNAVSRSTPPGSAVVVLTHHAAPAPTTDESTNAR